MRVIIACLLLLPFSVFAGSVGTTKTFASGDTLTATDLNGNVTALTTAIDDNDTRITTIVTKLPIVVVDGNSQEIGTLLSINGQSFDILTLKGYSHTSVSFGTGATNTLSTQGTYFASSGCSGTAYTVLFNGEVRSVYNTNGTISKYYVEKSSLAVKDFVYASQVNSAAGCIATGGTFTFALLWPTILNDSVVTGVSETPYTLPINLQRTQ